jgi:hypothetical protein
VLLAWRYPDLGTKYLAQIVTGLGLGYTFIAAGTL